MQRGEAAIGARHRTADGKCVPGFVRERRKLSLRDLYSSQAMMTTATKIEDYTSDPLVRTHCPAVSIHLRAVLDKKIKESTPKKPPFVPRLLYHLWRAV